MQIVVMDVKSSYFYIAALIHCTCHIITEFSRCIIQTCQMKLKGVWYYSINGTFMLEYLTTYLFSLVDVFFQQTIDIPMGTNCAPPLTNLFLYSNEADFIQGLFKKNEFGCFGMVRSSYSTSGTRCVNLVTNPVINHE